MNRKATTRSRKASIESRRAALDPLLMQMQLPAHRRGVDRLFAMNSQELGEAAVRAARGDKRRKSKKG